jgi:hypothetical protein
MFVKAVSIKCNQTFVHTKKTIITFAAITVFACNNSKKDPSTE